MFRLKTFSSPERSKRLLGLTITIEQTNIQIEHMKSSPRGDLEEEKRNLTSPKPIVADSIDLPLEACHAKLVALTVAYFNHMKVLALAVLKNCPIQDLEKIQIGYHPESKHEAPSKSHPVNSQLVKSRKPKIESRINPDLILKVTIAGETLSFDGEHLMSKLNREVEKWVENPCKKIIFKKLHHVAQIYHLLHNSDKIAANILANQILAVKNYIEKEGVVRDMRTPRTDNVLPGDTRGGVYMKNIISLIYNNCIVIENTIPAPDIGMFNRIMCRRLEWQTLNYLNLLTDQTIAILRWHTPADLLLNLHEKSSQILNDDGRFIIIEHPQAPVPSKDAKDELKDSIKEKEGMREFKIHLSVLKTSVSLFPANRQAHLEKCMVIWALLSELEETNTKVEDVDKIASFFVLINSTFIPHHYDQPTSCTSFLWPQEKNEASQFLSNAKKIHEFYGPELQRLELARTPMLSPGRTLSTAATG